MGVLGWSGAHREHDIFKVSSFFERERERERERGREGEREKWREV